MLSDRQMPARFLFVPFRNVTRPARRYLMRLLLSNDDGCFAPGLAALHRALSDRYSDIVTVAPDRNRSGASNSLTLKRPIRVRRESDVVYCVEGTPTDCVHLATTGLLEPEPDMVISGINEGSNLGDDVLYSGTVAGATEGRSLGLPAVAISIAGDSPQHYETAARVAVLVVERLQSHPLDGATILNVNVPDLPWQELNGFAATRLGNRHRAEGMIRDTDPRGTPIYWIGNVGAQSDAGPGTDFRAIAKGQVSVTPIQVDLTCHDALENVTAWVEEI